MPAKKIKAKSNERPSRSVERRPVAGEYRDLWANDMQSSHTPWDFALTFGIIAEATSDKLAINDYVTVHLSPQFMIRVLQTLEVNIAKYEEKFGQIQMPKGLENRSADEMEVSADNKG